MEWGLDRGAEEDSGPVPDEKARRSRRDRAGGGVPDFDKELALYGGAVAGEGSEGASLCDLCDVGDEITPRRLTTKWTRWASFW